MSKKKKNLKLQSPPSLLNICKSPLDLHKNQDYFTSQFTGKSNFSFEELQMLKKSPLYFDTETGVCLGFEHHLMMKAKENADAEKKQIMEAINVECASKVNAEKKKKRL